MKFRLARQLATDDKNWMVWVDDTRTRHGLDGEILGSQRQDQNCIPRGQCMAFDELARDYPFENCYHRILLLQRGSTTQD
ncbi:hypothetical protein Y032_0118g763 [Ancylostoma ceylanicum]|nr:hypothetical protein Y032_0118g763 [Ancylostoma ceylanicum]